MRPSQRETPKQDEEPQEQAETIQQVPQEQEEPQKEPLQQGATPSPSSGAPFNPTRRVGARGGPQLFAQKLFTLVEEEDPEIVEWLPDGLAFRVKDIQRFSTEVLEKYFNREYCMCLILLQISEYSRRFRLVFRHAYAIMTPQDACPSKRVE